MRRRVVIGTLPHDQGVWPVAFSPDGRFLAVGDGSEDGPGTVKVYDIQKRQVVVNLNGNPKSVKSVEFSSDNRYLASCGWNGYLKIWDVSNWAELWTLPGIGHRDFAFSPDAKVIVASSGSGSVNLYWVEDGTNIAELSGLQGWRHPVDFSLDGTFALGAEDGKVRIWRIDTSPIDGHQAGAVLILHIETYFQELSRTNAATAANIPEPVPPPAIVRAFFDLDPFYEQWINVGGLPVIASAKVNPYALREAAWLIEKMIGHRRDVLRTMVGNKNRFAVIAHTEIITEIPEYRNDTPVPPDFLIFREQGWGGGHGDAVSSSEENILNYRGDFTGGRYNVLIHEFAHGIHRFGFGFDSPFDVRLGKLYEAAVKKGLWHGTYANSDRREYWAEGTHAWFHPNGGGSFDRFGNTRQALKRHDPGLARLLAEVYGDGPWRYTLPETRTHLPHLLGFNPQKMPTFNGWPELETLYRKLHDPKSTGGGKWINLKLYAPNQLSRLQGSEVQSERATLIYVNHTDSDILGCYIASDGTQTLRKRTRPGHVRWSRPYANQIVLVKDTNGKNIAIFQTEDQTGRALIGATPRQTPKKKAPLTVDVNADGKVNKTDLLHVVKALGKKSRKKIRVDVNGDGIVDVADLLLVIEHLDDPEVAAAPIKREIVASLNPGMLSAYLAIMRAENDGTPAYAKAIAFLDSLRVASTPEETALLTNYPNPFNPETWIPYQLAESADVSLTIYDIRGIAIRRFDLGCQPAGDYESRSRAAYWDGRNALGESMASGIYFYMLTAGEFSATRPMILVK